MSLFNHLVYNGDMKTDTHCCDLETWKLTDIREKVIRDNGYCVRPQCFWLFKSLAHIYTVSKRYMRSVKPCPELRVQHPPDDNV